MADFRRRILGAITGAALLGTLAVGVGAGTAVAGSPPPPPPPPAAGCDYAAHPGTGGTQYDHMTPQAKYAAVVLCNEGILTGTAPNLFSPYIPVTRAQAVKFIVKALGVPLSAPQTPSFTDVSVQSPYYLYIETAEKLGILPFATAGGPFLPSQDIKRDEFAALAVDALGDQAAANALATKGTVYRDDATIPSQYRGDVNEALALGIVPPYNATLYKPAGSLMRVGFALGILRFYNQLQLSAPASMTLAASATDVGIGSTSVITPTIKSATGGALNWSQLEAAGYSLQYAPTPATGATVAADQSTGLGTFVGSSSGAYTVTATLTGPGLKTALTASVKIAVYGVPTQIAVTGTSSVVADGKSTDTLTATVEDANGNAVGNYDGSLTIADTVNNGAVTLPTTTTEAATNGVATFVVTGTTNPGRTDTLTVSGSNGTTPLTSGTFQVSTVAPTASAVKVMPASSYLSVNTVNSEQVQAEVVDQGGNPMPSGVYTVDFNVSGSGTFANGSTAQQSGTYIGEGSGTPVLATTEVYSIQGDPGTITVTASAAGLTSGSATISAVITGAAKSLKATVVQAGQAGAAYGSSGQAEIQVTAVDANGVPVNVAQNDPLTFTFNPTTNAPTVHGPVSILQNTNSVTADLTDNTSGTWTFTVTDSLGLAEATGSVTFAAGQPQDLSLTPMQPTGSHLTVSNQAVTFTAQVTDANGNPVPDSGVSVTFTCTAGSGNHGTATLTGNSSVQVAPGATESVQATTNASGAATVSFTPDGVTGDTFTLYASAANLANSSTADLNVQYTSPQSISLSVKNTLGQSISQITADPGVYAEVFPNVTGAGGVPVPSGDILQATVTSGTLQAGNTGGTLSNNNQTLTFTWVQGGGQQFNFYGGAAGSATVTVTDQSAASPVSGTTTIYVAPGAPYEVAALSYGYTNGTFQATQSGVFGPFTLAITDAGGNTTSDQAPVTLSASQVAQIVGGSGAASVTGVRTSSGGLNVSSLTFNAGVDTQQVWVEIDNSTGATLTQSSGLLSADDPIASVTLSGDAGQIDGNTKVQILFTTPINTGTAPTFTLGVTSSGVAVTDLFNLNGTYNTGTTVTEPTGAVWSSNNQELTLSVNSSGSGYAAVPVTVQPTTITNNESTLEDEGNNALAKTGETPTLNGSF